MFAKNLINVIKTNKKPILRKAAIFGSGAVGIIIAGALLTKEPDPTEVDLLIVPIDPEELPTDQTED